MFIFTMPEQHQMPSPFSLQALAKMKAGCCYGLDVDTISIPLESPDHLHVACLKYQLDLSAVLRVAWALTVGAIIDTETDTVEFPCLYLDMLQSQEDPSSPVHLPLAMQLCSVKLDREDDVLIVLKEEEQKLASGAAWDSWVDQESSSRFSCYRTAMLFQHHTFEGPNRIVRAGQKTTSKAAPRVCTKGNHSKLFALTSSSGIL